MPRTIHVHEPAPLQAFLFDQFPDVKRIKIKQWLKFGAVEVNGRRQTRFDHALAIGDEVTVQSVAESRAASLLPRGLKVVFEDDSIIVIDKPPNVLSIASEAEKEKTVYAMLTNYVRGGNERHPARVFIVHRLDMETSGVMIFAKSDEVKMMLQENWETCAKHYYAVVEGGPAEDSGTVRSFLDERNPHHVYSVPESEHTRHAITHYQVLKRGAKHSLVELELVTGRRHQIRVQMKELGCPVAGDEKYSAKTNPAGRLALHSCFLRIQHPVTEQEMVFKSDLPPTLARVVK
jgi:23S rRNA pseudouridine1911/1915/1917 synthase